MKKILMTVLMTALVLTLVSGKSFSDDDSGTFRGKWWNYYDRGISKADQGDWENSMADLQKAVSMRNRDQRMARTYGMHFIDYFPHRELGIVFLNRGEIESAISELEESIRGEESAKANYFLNKARKAGLSLQKGKSVMPPSVMIETPLEG